MGNRSTVQLCNKSSAECLLIFIIFANINFRIIFHIGEDDVIRFVEKK